MRKTAPWNHGAVFRIMIVFLSSAGAAGGTSDRTVPAGRRGNDVGFRPASSVPQGQKRTTELAGYQASDADALSAGSG